jgi:hypothetical protein
VRLGAKRATLAAGAGSEERTVKALLAKFAYKAIGLHVGDREVTLCEVASTPFGPVQTSCRTERYESEKLGETLGRLLEPWLAGRKRRFVPVAVGMPGQRVFFSTRPIRTTHSDPSPQALIHEVLQSPNHSIDDMVVEVIKGRACSLRFTPRRGSSAAHAPEV